MSNLSLRSSLLTSLLPLLVAAPSPAQRDGCRDQAGTRSEIVVAPTTEPGERLRIEGFVLDEEGKALPGVEVRVFQTDAAGWYSRELALSASDPFAGTQHFRAVSFVRPTEEGWIVGTLYAPQSLVDEGAAELAAIVATVRLQP